MPGIERPRSLTRLVADRLRDAIVDGTIGLGTLLSEKTLAKEFGTSKTPVREAIVQLQSLGLVEVLPQRGGVVFQPTVDQVRELCEVRYELEEAAFRLSVARHQEAFAHKLADIAQEMGEAFDVKKPVAYQRLDTAFHGAFFEYCGNKLLGQTYELIAPRICALRTHLSTPLPRLRTLSLSEHRALARIARKGDVEAASKMLRTHVERTRECHLQVLAEVQGAA